MTMATQAVEPRADRELDAQIVAILQLEEDAQKLEITNDANAVRAHGWLVEISKNKKAIEDKRKFFTKPLLDHKKRIDDEFKQYAQPLERANTLLRRGLLVWQQEQSRKRREEEERLRRERDAEQKRMEAEAVAENEPAPIPPPLPVPATAAVPQTTKLLDGGSVTTAKRWVFEIVDTDAVPREHCVPDAGKIRRLVQAGLREIAGVRIFEKNSLRVWS